jgi:hypothetical protein
MSQVPRGQARPTRIVDEYLAHRWASVRGAARRDAERTRDSVVRGISKICASSMSSAIFGVTSYPTDCATIGALRASWN